MVLFIVEVELSVGDFDFGFFEGGDDHMESVSAGLEAIHRFARKRLEEQNQR